MLHCFMEFSPSLFTYLQEEGLDQTASNSNEAELLAFLTLHMAQLLEKKPGSLKQIFYRLDVSESKVAQVFGTKPESDWALELARLVLDREKQRLFWREHYRNNPS